MTQYDAALLYGCGYDGPVHVNTNPCTIVDPQASGGVASYIVVNNVLQRDINPSSLLIDPGCVLKTSNWLIQCPGAVTNQGTLDCSGPDASGSTAGVWGDLGSMLAGALTAGMHPNGVNGATGSPGSAGPTYGYGGVGGKDPAASAVTRTLSGAGPSDPIYFLDRLTYQVTVGLNTYTIAGWYAGGGGGRGAGDGTNKGGAGGAAGGAMAIFAHILDNSAGTITIKGGKGGTPIAGNTGGGHGGGGGFGLFVVSNLCGVVTFDTYFPWTLGAIDLSGGQGGSGHGTGNAGNSGAPGDYFVARLSPALF